MSAVSKLRRVGAVWRVYLRLDYEVGLSPVWALGAVAREVGKFALNAASSGQTFELVVDVVASQGQIDTGDPESVCQGVYRYCSEVHADAVSFVFVGITQPTYPLLGRDIWFSPVCSSGTELGDQTDPKGHLIVYPPTS
eukprot:Rhum_TRINITY_DN13372_c0_g1::Rhum_TRINITY_DN13372_c0_g1_i1::g.59605::m.59605